jgi:hypothetical protein
MDSSIGMSVIIALMCYMIILVLYINHTRANIVEEIEETRELINSTKSSQQESPISYKHI